MSTRRRAMAAMLATGLLAAAALAYTPPTRVQNILVTAPSREALHASLRAYADSVHGQDANAEGEALRFLAEAAWRAGQRDSALALAERAVAARGDVDERLLLADALLERGGAEDLARVPSLLAGERMQVMDGPAARRAPLTLRMAWARLRLGDASDAASLVSDDLDALASAPEWARRLAPVIEQLPPRRRAWRVLVDAAARTQGRDSALVRLAHQAAERVHPDSTLVLPARIGVDRSAEQEVAERRGGGLLGRLAEAPLWHVPAIGGAAGRALVLLPGEGSPLAAADSLIDGLRALRLDVQACSARWFVSSQAATTFGSDASERAIEAAVLTALGPDDRRAAPTVIVAAEDLALPAARVARAHASVRAIVLLTPWPAAVDRGALAAALRDARVPVYLQTAPETAIANEYADRLAAQLPPRQVRVADGRMGGRGVTLLRRDGAALRRLLEWVSESMRAPRATPPRRPPRG